MTDSESVTTMLNQRISNNLVVLDYLVVSNKWCVLDDLFGSMNLDITDNWDLVDNWDMLNSLNVLDNWDVPNGLHVLDSLEVPYDWDVLDGTNVCNGMWTVTDDSLHGTTVSNSNITMSNTVSVMEKSCAGNSKNKRNGNEEL